MMASMHDAPMRRRGDRPGMRIPGVAVDDSRHALAILQYLVDRANYQGEVDALLTQISAHSLDALRRMSVTDLSRLAEQRPPFLSICVDEPMLALAMHRMSASGKREEDALWFITRGAPAATMLDLFGMSDFEYRRLRALTSVSTRRGRAPKLDQDILKEVQAKWTRHRDAFDRTERFKRLCVDHPDEPIAALWCAVRDYA